MLFAPEFAATTPTPAGRRRRSLTRTTALLLATVVGGGIAAAAVAGATETVWDRVAMCESGGNWAINTGNGYYGGLQFSATTWSSYGGTRYATRADLASKGQQVEIAQKVLAAQGPGAWPTCGAKAGLTRENGAAVDPYADGTGTDVPTITATVPNNDGTRVSRALDRPLVVDGVLGSLTNRAVEMWVGGTVNGSLSVTDVKKLQSRLRVVPDGDIGPQTTYALQGRVGATRDGDWGPMTTKALQGFLNTLLYRG